MRIPSRRMPLLKRPPAGVIGWLVLGTLALIFAYLIAKLLSAHLWVGSALLGAFLAWAYFDDRRQRRRLENLAAARLNASICHFARSFDARQVDTWIIRAVYEEVRAELEHTYPSFPVCSEDRLDELIVDPDALDMSIAPNVAERTGRSLDNANENPYFGKVRTVGDLVLFLNAQPLKSAA
jgi:hypothetical protein